MSPNEHPSPSAAQQPAVSSGPLPALAHLRHGDKFLQPQLLEEICQELGIPRPPLEILSAIVELKRNDTTAARQGRSLEEVREEYRQQLREWMLDPSQRGKIKLVSLPPGSGKTQISIEIAGEESFSDRHIHFVWGMYAVRDRFSDLMDGWLHIEGRNEENCQHHSAANRLGNLGYSVRASLCRQCPDQRGCSYLQAWKKVEQQDHRGSPATFVHQLLTQWQVWNCDVLIVDEEFIDACLLKTQFSREEIEASEEGGPACERLRYALADLLRQLEGLSPEEERNLKLGITPLDVWKQIETQVADLGSVLGQARKEVEISDNDNLPHLPDAWGQSKVGNRTPRPAMYTIVQALRKQEEWHDQHPDSHYDPLGVELVWHGKRYVSALVYRNHWVWRRFAHGQPPLLIILDASTPRDLYQRILGVDEDQIEKYTRDVGFSQGFEAWHVPDTVYSKFYLDRGSGTWNAAVHKAEYALLLAGAEDTKIGVATFESWKEMTAQSLGVTDKEATCHFFGSRGTNNIDDAGVETLVVIGTPNLPGDTAENMARALQEERGNAEKLKESIRQVYNIQELEQTCYRLRPLNPREDGKAKRLIIVGDTLPQSLGTADLEVRRLPNISKVRAFLKVALAWRYCIAQGDRHPSINRLSNLTGCQWRTVKTHVETLKGLMTGW